MKQTRTEIEKLKKSKIMLINEKQREERKETKCKEISLEKVPTTI